MQIVTEATLRAEMKFWEGVQAEREAEVIAVRLRSERERQDELYWAGRAAGAVEAITELLAFKMTEAEAVV
jgi:hypothetical protein